MDSQLQTSFTVIIEHLHRALNVGTAKQRVASARDYAIMIQLLARQQEADK